MQPAGQYKTYGCNHYMRKCYLLPTCCKRHVCHVCHNQRQSHLMIRESCLLVCKVCLTKQLPDSNCQNCFIEFGQYSCNTCLLYDDRERGQYHCDQCGFCRLGGEDNFFHCPKCDVCLPIEMMEHQCVENASKTACPLCLEDMHMSRLQVAVLKCGHLIHLTCWNKIKRRTQVGRLECPICREQIIESEELQLIAVSAV